jgi:hypothetical protein
MTTIINGSSPSITFSDGSAQTSATRPFLNRIINGAMVIDQRNAGASWSISGTPTYGADRWEWRLGTSTGSTVQQVTTAPTGFNYSSKLIIGTGASPAAGIGTGYFNQKIEGYNVGDLGWGTASAKTITLSFWVYSSLTGTFGLCVTNDALDYSYPTSYTINAANTWEQKTITIAGPTTGTWLTTTGVGIRPMWDLGCGSNYKGTANTWAAADYRGGATGTQSICATSGATWYITGVQLEVGSTATSFDYRPYGTELSLCYRYCYNLYTGANLFYAQGNYYTGTEVLTIIPFPVTMRTTPTISYAGLTTFYRNGAADSNNISSWTLQYSSTNFANLSATSMSGTAGQAGTLYSTNAAAKMSFLAEL